MRKLDYNEYKLCQMQAKIFEASLKYANFSSPMFIRRFMMSDIVYEFDDMSYLFKSSNIEDSILELNKAYKESTKSPLYTENQMYWIGYVYRALAILYNKSSKSIYKLFPAKEIIKYYNVFHTFFIEEACERMMETIGYEDSDYTKLGVKILKRLANEERMAGLLNKEYTINESSDYFDTYVLSTTNKKKTKAVGYISYDDSDATLLLSSDNKKYTKKDIEKLNILKDKKHKVVLSK